MRFQLNSPYKPAGDQPEAIEQLTNGVLTGEKYQRCWELREVVKHLQWPM